MSHYSAQIALVCFLITLGIQLFAHSMPPTLLQAARVTQVILGVLFIYFFAQLIINGGL